MPTLTTAVRDLTTSRNLLLGVCTFFFVLFFGTPVTAAHGAYLTFLATSLACAWVMRRGALEQVSVERLHQPRIFEGDQINVRLVVRRARGLGQPLVVVEDQFFAALSTRQRHLIPMMTPRWEALLQYTREVERHRGLYILGPVSLWTADPLGIFARRIEVGTITPLTVYARAVPLSGYRMLGPYPPSGPTLEAHDRLGQGEEIISVRPYRPGDPMNRIHWRTSVRRGELHTIELNTYVQTEVAIFIDLTRPSRYGTGAESTTEMAIGCATSILSEAGASRQRIGMTLVRDKVEYFPPGVGLANLHLMLDRLAVVSPAGEMAFWTEAAPRSALLRRGARAIFIVPGIRTPLAESTDLVRRLISRSVAVDVILLNEANMTRIWRDQSPTVADAALNFAQLQRILQQAGARVLPLVRGEAPGQLLPRAAQD